MRRATTADASLVGRLLFDFNTEFESVTPSAEELGSRFGTLLGREDVLVLLAEEGASGAPAVAFAYLTFRPTPYGDGPIAQLEELYVRPELRDHGIGTDLLAAALADSMQRGAIEMYINVDEVDVDTRRFYERHGFVNIEPGADYRMLFYMREL
ncbi:GNAT family N-acetyltransferase [Agromyces humatus]|uniref:GNAT family N-acetyltransferase n=1 Tax=Agromyces humatus TaxID=279573 RepID=A0ABN2L042_9MICO